jgi:TolB-like protein
MMNIGKRICFDLVVIIACACISTGCARKPVLYHDMNVPVTRLDDKKPISVRAAEAREKKVYDFKQHYMKPESAGTQAVTARSETSPAHTVKPRIAVSRFGDTKNIAINPFSAFIGQTAIDQQSGTVISTNWDNEAYEGFTADVITALVKLDRFIVVEREEINKIIREQGFQATNLTENLPNKDFGAITGVEYILTGSVHSDEAANVIVNMRIYDVYRGMVIAAERIAAPSKWEAIERAVGHVAEKVEPKAFVLKVSTVNAQTVYANGGQAQGITSGKYEVFSVGAPIVDPDTNALLSVEEEKIALIDLSGVQSNYSVGTIIEQTRPLKTGDIVRPYQGVYFDGDTMDESGFLPSKK